MSTKILTSEDDLNYYQKDITENLKKSDAEAYNNLFMDAHFLNNAFPENSASKVFQQLPKGKDGKVHGACATIELKEDEKGNSILEVTPLFSSKEHIRRLNTKSQARDKNSNKPESKK